MNYKFRKTKAGVKICPFFSWTSENIEGLGHQENDVNLTICCHERNPHYHEGNCQGEWCPILEQHPEIKLPTTPTYWICPDCGKWDTSLVEVQLASPEHRTYRGVDVGTCKGIMIPLYTKESLKISEYTKKTTEYLLDDLQEIMCLNVEEPAGRGCGYGISEAGQLAMKKVIDNYLGTQK